MPVRRVPMVTLGPCVTAFEDTNWLLGFMTANGVLCFAVLPTRTGVDSLA